MHLVDSLEFELDAADEAQAFALQGPLQAFLRGRALRVIDEVLTAAAPGGEVWRLDRLEIDLGEVPADAPAAAWERRLRERLAEALARAQRDPAQRATAARLPTADSALQVLLHFLHHGRLPWHGPAWPAGGFAGWAEAVVQARAPALARALAAPGAAVARERALRQLGGRALAALAAALGPAAALQPLVQARLAHLPAPQRALRERAAWAAAVRALWRPGGTDARGLAAAVRTALRDEAGAEAPTPLAALAQALRQRQAPALAAAWPAAWRQDPAAAAALLRHALARRAGRRWLLLALPPAQRPALLRRAAPAAAAALALLWEGRRLRPAWQAATGQRGRALELRVQRLVLEAIAEAGGADPAPARVLAALLRRAGGLPLARALRAQAGPPAAALLDAWLAEAARPALGEAWQRAGAALARGEPPEARDLALLLAQDRAALRAALRPLAADPVRARRFATLAALAPGAPWLRLLGGAEAARAAALLQAAPGLGLGADGTLLRRCLIEAWLAEPPAGADPRRWFGRFLRLLAAARGLRPALLREGLAARLARGPAPLRALAEAPPPPAPPALERWLRPQAGPACAGELAAWQAALARREPTLAQRLRQALAQNRLVQGLVRRLPEWLLRRLAQRLRPGQPAPAALPPEGWVALLQGRPLPPVPRTPPAEAGAPIALANAGLVLLAPYLPRWLGMLGLLQGGHFASPEAAQRAARLLQWLVDGRGDADEAELALPRLLCGLPFALPLPAALEPTPQEVDSGTQLLQAVIAHWGALGRTTVAGLRETFLQREGRLQRDGEAWRLVVAPRAFDLLLDRLPWGWRTLRLSTMDRVLHVDWR